MQKQSPRKLTILLDAELEQRLFGERERIAAAEGVIVSLTAIATRAMRLGFGSGDAR